MDIGPGEQWAPIPATDGAYEVSSLGRVRRTVEMRHGQLPAWGMVRCRPNNHGYPMFNTTLNGMAFNIALHRLVLGAFVGPCPEGLQAAHLNGDKTDARLENLAYVTAKENNAHKALHGTAQRGERNPCAKLTEADVLAIRASAEPNTAIVARYGLNASHVSDIRRGAVWKHLHAESANVG